MRTLEALELVVLVRQHKQVLVVATLLVLQPDTDLLVGPTEVVLTTILVMLDSVAVEGREEMVVLVLPSREETAALVERTCLVHHEAEAEAVTRTEMAEELASQLVEARVAEMEQTTTLVATHLALERLTTELEEVQTGTNVGARMLVALES